MTFARKAAGEMAERLPPELANRVRVGTIHSVCYEVLRAEIPGRRVCDEAVKKRLEAALSAQMSSLSLNSAAF